jgi:hypothetical protein
MLSGERGHRMIYWDFPFRLAPPLRVNNGRGSKVRVREDARKCSVFLGYQEKPDSAAISPAGTGFLVTVGGVAGLYLVTAAHVAKALGTDPFVIRFNDKDGVWRLDHNDGAEWHYHEDSSVDVAVMRYVPPDWADCTVIPVSEFVNAERLRHYDVGPGDAEPQAAGARSLRAIAAGLDECGIKTPRGIGLITVMPVSTFGPKMRFRAL